MNINVSEHSSAPEWTSDVTNDRKGSFYIYLLAVNALLCSVLVKRWMNKRSDGIPGPWSLPVIGTLHHIGLNPHLAFQKMRKLYGDVFRIRIGSQDMIVISGLKVIQEALVNKAAIFAGRPQMYTFQFLSEGKSLSFNTYDSVLKQHRRIAEWGLYKVLENGGIAHNIISEEAIILQETFGALNGQLIDPIEYIMWSIGHVLYRLNFGDSRKEVKDFEHVVKGTVSLIDMHNRGSFLNFFPWTRTLLSWKCKEIDDLCQSICGVAKDKEKEHLLSYKADDMRDGIDAMIKGCQRVNTGIDLNRVLHTTQDFMGAGLDIVYITLTWAIWYLAEYPEIQENIKSEIRQSCIKGKRTVDIKDCKSLSYTNAFVYEVMRHSSVVPFALPHNTLETTSLSGYVIPKNSFIMVDLHSVHTDDATWKNPNKFDPERFLKDDGTLDDRQKDKCIAFSLGKRKCIGEQLGRQILVVFVVKLLNNLIVKKSDSMDNGNYKPSFGLVLKPKMFKVRFLKDQDS